MTDYWIKCVNRKPGGNRVEVIEVTENLQGSSREKLPRSALIANLKQGADVKTAERKTGRWREGEKVVLQGRWVTVDSKEDVNRDDLGGLQKCRI